jgi:hypothetical protein
LMSSKFLWECSSAAIAYSPITIFGQLADRRLYLPQNNMSKKMS